MRHHYVISVEGRVQGVGYRYFVRAKAGELRIRGFVRNGYDGSVMVEAEGEKTDLDTLVDYLRIGPPLARVSRVEVSVAPCMDQFEDFVIKS
jgi:acylphosphatase